MRFGSPFPLACVLTALAALLSGCGKDAERSQSVASTVASASASAAPRAPLAPKVPPFAGKYEGTFDAALFRIEMTKEEGAVKEWSEDDGKTLSGAGTLILKIDENRTITGTSSGSLGNLRASGNLDDDRIRVSLLPESPGPIGGSGSATLVGKLEADSIVGTLRASSGDSLKARTAAVRLSKAGSENAPTKATPDSK